jgi:hypothetical protein
LRVGGQAAARSTGVSGKKPLNPSQAIVEQAGRLEHLLDY